MEYPCKYGKPGFAEKNKIWPQAEGDNTSGMKDKGLFAADKIGNSPISTSKKFAKSGKGATIDKGVFKHKPNQIWPDKC